MTKHEVTSHYLQTGAPSVDELRRGQAECDECQEILAYLEGRLGDIGTLDDLKRLGRLIKMTTSTHNTNGRKAHLRSDDSEKWERCVVVEDGVIYRRHGNERHGYTHLPFVPSQLRLAILVAFHERMGHPSRDRTFEAIRSRYYWPSLRQDVFDYVSECHECTLAKPPRAVNRKPVGPTLGRYPFDLLYADILDMANTADYDKVAGTGARKLIVFADSLSRWVEAIPLHKDPS